jgi:hypothetical protein
MNSSNGHHQRRRPPQRGVVIYSQCRYRHTFCMSKLITTNRGRIVESCVVVEISDDSERRYVASIPERLL